MENRHDGRKMGTEIFREEFSDVNDKWNAEQANQLLRAALGEIDELGDKLSPARAETLLDKFERDDLRWLKRCMREKRRHETYQPLAPFAECDVCSGGFFNPRSTALLTAIEP